jgi:protein-S-isoprenylcysteine O-methyltransferase Ste14
VSCGSFLFRHRDTLFPAILFGLVLASPPGALAGSRLWDRLLDAAGIAAALGGQALRALVIALAYIRRGGLNKRIHADSLVVEGVFAHTRNPLYLGNFLALVGFSLIHDSWLCYAGGLPVFAFGYLAMVTAEEEFLLRRFGEPYAAYCRRVNRFLPALRGLGRTIAGLRFDWRRLVRKEYGSTFAGAGTVLALLAWDDARRLGYPGSKPTLSLALLLWAALVPFYLVARWLKKSGRLGTGAAESSSVRRVRRIPPGSAS